MVAAFQLMRKGNDPVRPRDDLDYSANFLYMSMSEEPDPLAARIFDVCLTLTLNIRWTLHILRQSDGFYSYWPLCRSRFSSWNAGRTAAWWGKWGLLACWKKLLCRECVPSGGSLRQSQDYGFWSSCLQSQRSTATILQNLAEQLFEKFGHDKYYDIAVEMERVIEEKLSQKGIYPNVDFYSGLVCIENWEFNGFIYPDICDRQVAGWLAHWKNNWQKTVFSVLPRFQRSPWRWLHPYRTTLTVTRGRKTLCRH